MNSVKAKKQITKRSKQAISSKKSLQTLLLKGPVMSESQFEAFLKTRDSFEQWKGK
jgi:hypothetical protein